MDKEIQKYIDELQEKWRKLQLDIDDCIKRKDHVIAFRKQTKATTIKSCIKRLYLILNSESTGGISASSDESGILHVVEDCNASRE